MANETVSIKTFTLVKASFYLQVNNLSGFTHHLPGDEKARQGTVRDNRPMEASMVMALRPPYCNKLQTHSWRPKRTFQKPIKYVYIYIYQKNPWIFCTQVMSSMPTKQGSKCCSDLKLEGTKNMHPFNLCMHCIVPSSWNCGLWISKMKKKNTYKVGQCQL